LDIERCGLGYELRVEHPVINKQGWLRAAFWIHETSKTIYVVDLFWKKTNKLSTADLARIDYRIRQLKLRLAEGEKPWGG
jgi:phage-related protein